MRKLADAIDFLNEHIGRAIAWLALAMVLMMAANVFMRYAFSMGHSWQQESVRFMHGILFLGGAAYALKHEAQVRVDVLYQNMTDTRKAWMNLLGTMFFLWPTAGAILYFSAGYVLGSWDILEGSSEYRGMPGVFVFKSFIWVCGALLFLQGISMIIRSWKTIRSGGHNHIISED